jgi:hypothetical protein
MRVRVACGWRAMCRPTGVGNADIASGIIRLKDIDEIGQLALRAAADELAVKNGADARAVIAPIFHPLQTIDEPIRDGRFANNSDNSAHKL